MPAPRRRSLSPDCSCFDTVSSHPKTLIITMKLMTSKIRRGAAGALIALAASLTSAPATTITGAGSTFDNPAFQSWFEAYSKIDADAQFNYQSVGSGAGIQQLTKQTVDFGASDAPMK